jgi:hypothetical protein
MQTSWNLAHRRFERGSHVTCPVCCGRSDHCTFQKSLCTGSIDDDHFRRAIPHWYQCVLSHIFYFHENHADCSGSTRDLQVLETKTTEYGKLGTPSTNLFCSCLKTGRSRVVAAAGQHNNATAMRACGQDSCEGALSGLLSGAAKPRYRRISASLCFN